MSEDAPKPTRPKKKARPAGDAGERPARKAAAAPLPTPEEAAPPPPERDAEERDADAASVERAAEVPRARAGRRPRGAELGTKLSSSLGIVAALVLATLVNVMAQRRYERWDLTRAGRFTLSAPTKETLKNLAEPVRVIVLLSKNDPLGLGLHQMLEAYRAESPNLIVESIDPDRDRAALIAVQQKYGLAAGERDGHVVTDAAAIVVRGSEHHYIRPDDLVRVEGEDDAKAKPRLEHAVTGAIRTVVGGDRPTVCFTTGHGERTIEEGGEMGLAALRDRLDKNNYEVRSVFGDDTADTTLRGCSLLVVAAPTQPVPRARVDAMKAFVLSGESALVVAGPVPDERDRDFLSLGIDDLVALAGVRLGGDFVFELDPAQRSTGGHGETFFAGVQQHPITQGVVGRAPVILTAASSLGDLGGATKPEALLVTSPTAFGMVDFFGWAQDPGPPKAGDRDHTGPLVVAAAAELPKPSDSKREHGPRIVVVSALNPLFGGNWSTPEHRGTAMFVEGAITWLSAHRSFLDIPDKPSVTVGLRLTEETISSVFRYTVVLLPASTATLGVLVFLSRRRRRRRPDRAEAS